MGRHSMLAGKGVVVGVSGGPDSVALLDILIRLFELASEQHPRSIHIAHLDHMLRPRESADDAEFVRQLGNKLRIPVTVNAVDVRAVAETDGRGIEEVARETRYKFLATVAREAGFDRIAVGHTMTDQAETVLMRLIRGAGLRGISAMRPIAPLPAFRSAGQDGGGVPLLIRPLLCIAREEVEGYCRERGLEFRTDSTNASGDYTRNRIRNEIFPLLSGINPQAVRAIARAADNAASEHDAVDALARDALSRARLTAGLLGGEMEANTYSVTSFLEHPVGVCRQAIMEAIKLARVEEGWEVTATHIAAVEGLLDSSQSGKRVNLPGSLEVWREFDRLVFKPVSRSSNDITVRAVISRTNPSVEAGGVRIALVRGVPGSEFASMIAESRTYRKLSSRNWMVVALDDQHLASEFIVRPRLKGERAHVVGQAKTKKLKNLMIDHRIPSSRRAGWPVVTTPDGGYIWSPGLPPSLKLAATDETESLAILRASLI